MGAPGESHGAARGPCLHCSGTGQRGHPPRLGCRIIRHFDAPTLLGLFAAPGATEDLAAADGGAAVITVRAGDPTPRSGVVDATRTLPCVLVAHTTGGELDPEWLTLCDVHVVGDDELADVTKTIGDTPRAATALALLLRHSESRTVADGLIVESAVYSTLQAGPEFRTWRDAHPRRSRSDEDRAPRVVCQREDNRLDVVLSRPHVRNALDSRMRDELLQALFLAEADPSLDVRLLGAGAAFCSGGDLDEFGTRPDPATAHIVRLARSVGAAIAAIAPRVTAHLHGACYGSGIELPAFAGTVAVADDTVIALPEVGLGLVPGAGGTVSLPRRIGRHRTAWLALTGRTVDAATALAWGLADRRER